MAKKKIPSALRNLVWVKYISETDRCGKCYCCKTEKITTANFECGHIISENDGGLVNINNLRPICKNCNTSMGTMNMIDFMSTYFDKINHNNGSVKKTVDENIDENIIEEVNDKKKTKKKLPKNEIDKEKNIKGKGKGKKVLKKNKLPIFERIKKRFTTNEIKTIMSKSISNERFYNNTSSYYQSLTNYYILPEEELYNVFTEDDLINFMVFAPIVLESTNQFHDAYTCSVCNEINHLSTFVSYTSRDIKLNCYEYILNKMSVSEISHICKKIGIKQNSTDTKNVLIDKLKLFHRTIINNTYIGVDAVCNNNALNFKKYTVIKH